MSGIVGIYRRTGAPVDRAEVEGMLKTIAHRGPDAAVVWSEGPVGLGQCMLWTTPESLCEHMPRPDRTGSVVLTADARIDNRAELIDRLDLACRGRTISDSELILAAYERWGESCPEKLCGDFSFALWDQRRQTMMCARDPMGVKPLYYVLTDQFFAFASEIKALLCLPEVPRRLNEVRVVDYLSANFEDRASTLYTDVLRLPNASSLIVEPGRFSIRQYWTLDPNREFHLGSDDEYAEAFREVFAEAVRCRIRSAFPVGSTLSGGLDSSSIACTAERMVTAEGGGALHTFSAIFPTLPAEDLAMIDERRYMEQVLESGRFQPHFIYADELSPMKDVDVVQRCLDEANFAPNLYLHWAMYEAANQQGVRVFLDGYDGDSAVSHGWDSLSDLARDLRWRALARELRLLTRHQLVGYSRRQLLRDFCLQPLSPGWAYRAGQSLHFWPQEAEATRTLIDHELQRRVQASRSWTDRNKREPSFWTSNARQRHCEGLSQALFSESLGLTDRASAAFGVEARYPFFDRRLLEFCVALPPAQKLGQGWSRLILRRAMAGILPEPVRWRRGKADLGRNFLRRLLDRDGPLLDAVILNDSTAQPSCLDAAALRSAYEECRADPVGRRDTASQIFAAANLMLWLRAQA